MKKFFGLAGLVVAIALVSFTNVRRATHTLSFVGDVFIASEVADETKWREITPITCPTTAEVACRLEVPDDTYVTSSGGFTILNVSRVNLGAVVGYTDPNTLIPQYAPNKIGGSGLTPTFTNQFHMP